MPLLGIRHQHRFDAVLQERIVKLYSLGCGGAPIERAADVKRRRLRLVRMHDGRARKILAVGTIEFIVEKERHEVRDVTEEMLAHEVGYGRHRHCRREARVLGDEPRGHVAAMAPAGDA